MCFTLFGLMSFVVPSVASADTLKLSGSRRFACFDANSTDLMNNPRQYLFAPTGPLYYSMNLVTVNNSTTALVASLTGNGTNTDRFSGTSNESISLNGSEHGLINDIDLSGTVDNPNEGIGYTLSIDLEGTAYNDQLVSLNGSSSSNISMTNYGNSTFNGAITGTLNTNGYSTQYWEYRPNNGVDISNYSKFIQVQLFSGFGTFSAGTPILLEGAYGGQCVLHKDNGIDRIYDISNVYVFAGTATNPIRIMQSTSGRYIPETNYNNIWVVTFSNNVVADKYDSILIPNDLNVYRDLGYEYNQNVSSDISTQTNSVNNKIEQQTQNQTNQLKDTSGSDGILSAPQNMGNSIYEQVTFANQLAGVTTQLATTVASAEPNDASLTWPKFEFQGKTIWEEQTFSLWSYVPVEIASRLRLFNTMVIGLMWLRSLWVWISDIFDLHDDKHDPKEVVISEEVPVEAYQLDF